MGGSDEGGEKWRCGRRHTDGTLSAGAWRLPRCLARGALRCTLQLPFPFTCVAPLRCANSFQPSCSNARSALLHNTTAQHLLIHLSCIAILKVYLAHTNECTSKWYALTLKAPFIVVPLHLLVPKCQNVAELTARRQCTAVSFVICIQPPFHTDTLNPNTVTYPHSSSRRSSRVNPIQNIHNLHSTPKINVHMYACEFAPLQKALCV